MKYMYLTYHSHGVGVNVAMESEEKKKFIRLMRTRAAFFVRGGGGGGSLEAASIVDP